MGRAHDVAQQILNKQVLELLSIWPAAWTPTVLTFLSTRGLPTCDKRRILTAKYLVRLTEPQGDRVSFLLPDELQRPLLCVLVDTPSLRDICWSHYERQMKHSLYDAAIG
jgi:hypothetical protein